MGQIKRRPTIQSLQLGTSMDVSLQQVVSDGTAEKSPLPRLGSEGWRVANRIGSAGWTTVGGISGWPPALGLRPEIGRVRRMSSGGQDELGVWVGWWKI